MVIRNLPFEVWTAYSEYLLICYFRRIFLDKNFFEHEIEICVHFFNSHICYSWSLKQQFICDCWFENIGNCCSFTSYQTLFLWKTLVSWINISIWIKTYQISRWKVIPVDCSLEQVEIIMVKWTLNRICAYVLESFKYL